MSGLGTRTAAASLGLALAAGAGGAAEVELGLAAGARVVGDIGTAEGTVELSPGVVAGVSCAWRVRPDGLIEVAWTRQQLDAELGADAWPQSLDVTVDTLEIGGLWETRPGPRRPFLAAALGATRIAGPGQELSEAWYPSGSLSGGLRLDLGAHAVLRLEARAAGILLADGGALACGASGGGACGLSISGSLLGALEARAGLTARF